MAFALAAAVCGAACILLTQRVGDRITGEVLLLGLGLAVLLPAVPLCLELLALRRLSPAVFGT